jgi:hemerythrin-like domain-containing protein
MKVIDVLMHEHRVIEQVLDCLQAMVERVRSGQTLDHADAASAIEFLRTFDRCHHGKEEQQLFPAMVSKGIPQEAGPVAVMLGEHELGRAAVRGMSEALECGDEDRFAHHAREFVSLLRDHIAKEDNILFPLANSVLDAADQEALSAGFERIETEDIGADRHEEMIALAERLAETYGVALAAERGLQPFTGCSHAHRQHPA